MNFGTQDSFALPPCCKKAAPFFEESDNLRENALNWNDLIAAYYLRWKGIKVCYDMTGSLPPQEATLVKTICGKLMDQITELKEAYHPNETEGMVRKSRLFLTSYRQPFVSDASLLIMPASTTVPMDLALFQCIIQPHVLTTREYAYLNTIVVLYIETMESVGIITDQVNLLFVL